MSPRRAFDRLTLLTALTAIAAYCVAEGNAPMALVALPAAALSWWLRGRAFAADVPRIALNLILLAVLAYAVLTIIDEPIVTVDDVARLIMILLIVKLFDRHSARDAAQSLSLSLFLAIGAMLTSVRFGLGLLLIPMVPMLIAATMQYQVQAGYEAAARSARAARPPGLPTIAPRLVTGPNWRRQLRTVAFISAVAIVSTASAVFVLVPRGMNAGFMSRWGAPSAAIQTRFTSTVQLGRGGFLSDSQRVVMQMTVTDGEGNLIGGPDVAFRLRGNVLDKYDPQTNAWTRGESAVSRDRSDTYGPAAPLRFGNADGAKIVQHITLLDSSQGQRYLFTMQRPVIVSFDNRTARISFNMSDRRIVVSNDEGELRYTVESVDPDRPSHIPGRPIARPQEGPATFDSEPIHALTAQVLARAGLDPAWDKRDTSDDSRACRAIQTFLRDGYSYTTEIQAAPGGRDPIEWFLLDHKQGHCEYFASAMAAMCRSVGIPARVIAGYVAAEWNETSGSYVVRECNAHAWVEAQITDTDWRTFDPTPPSDLMRLHRPPAGLMTRIRHILDAMEHAWINSVVTYDQGARQRLFKEGARGADDWFTSLARLSENIRSGGFVLVIKAGLIGTIAFGLVAGGGRLVQVVLSWRARRRRIVAGLSEGAGEAAWREQTGFYPRLLGVLRSRGLAKPPWKPPLIHAAAIRPENPEASGAVERVAALYYVARFGSRRLTEQELAEAEESVRLLAAGPVSGEPDG